MNTIDLQALVAWYEQNKRAFPWRDTGEPYDVWLSEIMLQQTRIEVVKRRFTAFKKELPTISALAACDDDKLMRLWEGMGYYSRARNLKKCAQTLVKEYGSHLPADYDTLLKLPGIGPYTAAAIASISFHLPHPSVDGNVLRVVARLEGVRDDVREPQTVKQLTSLLQPFFYSSDFIAAVDSDSCAKQNPVLSAPKKKFIFSESETNSHQDHRRLLAELNPIDPGALNQAIMELGETICLPGAAPDCAHCPLQKNCYAHLHHETDSIPYRSKNAERKIIHRTLLVIRDGARFLIHKRPAKGLLAGLYEFPGVEKTLTKKEALSEASLLGITPLFIKDLPKSRHIFTHREWLMCAYEIRVEELEGYSRAEYLLVTKEELLHLAIPSAFKTYTDYYSLRATN